MSVVGSLAAGCVGPAGHLGRQRVMENSYGIVPMPYEVKAGAGDPFMITPETALIARGAEAHKSLAYLKRQLRKSCDLDLKREATANGKTIVLIVSDDAVPFREKDAYRLESSADRITIAAKTGRGLFYGVQSLLQLLPPEVYGNKVKPGLELKVPALVINDKPSMDRIRGLHVDIARHFRTRQELFKIIDSMAMHKLNTLYIHLADVEGWRVDIKAYPKLTTVGAIGNKANPDAPATFFTRDEIREICDYAASRYVSIIPEIDMPGHMGAAIRAYTELKSPTDTQDPGVVIRIDEEGQAFARNVLREVDEMFQPEFIHIGVDEVNYGGKGKIFTDEEIAGFATAMTSFIKDELKKIPIVWDDAFAHGFMDKDTLVHWWRYGKNFWWRNLEEPIDKQLNQARQPFILSPAYWTYFDMMNDGGGGWAKAISPAHVYNWDPYGDMLGVNEDTRDLVQGAIACTWSEKIRTMKHFCDRTYPRLACFSERVWRGGKLEAPDILSWPDYRDHVLIPFQLKRYDALGLLYWSKDKPELLRNLPDERKQI